MNFQRIIRVVGVLAFGTLALTGCDRQPAHGPGGERLTIFAAASLADSFTELAAAFEHAHPGVKLTINFAGSQQLRGQLEHGAPADLFAPASTREMAAAEASSIIDPATVRIFARNRLAVIVPQDNPARITVLRDLARPGIKIDVADPAVPAGAYTLQMLDAAALDPALGPEFKRGFLANVVSREENVKAVLAKVKLGEVDAGLVYMTDARADPDHPAIRPGVIEIPAALNPEAKYPMAVVKGSNQPRLAARFIEFTLSQAGQLVLERRGFAPALDRR